MAEMRLSYSFDDIDAGLGKAISPDATPTASSDNLVESGGVEGALSTAASTLNGAITTLREGLKYKLVGSTVTTAAQNAITVEDFEATDLVIYYDIAGTINETAIIFSIFDGDNYIAVGANPNGASDVAALAGLAKIELLGTAGGGKVWNCFATASSSDNLVGGAWGVTGRNAATAPAVAQGVKIELDNAQTFPSGTAVYVFAKGEKND